MKEFVKKYYQYLICAAAILISMMVLSIIKDYWPFGPVSMLSGDFLAQSTMFFSELKSKLINHESLAYTWNIGYGSNFFSILYFGHINPFTILFLIVPYTAWTPLSMIVYVLTLLLMSFSMLYFLRHRPFAHLEPSHPANILFAVGYAFCAYCISFANIWYFMVCAIFFPLILLGLEYFLAGKGWKLYFFTLLIAFISNYYLAGLFCLFIILYWLTLDFKDIKQFFGKSVRILVLSLCSIGVSGFMLVPTAVQMMGHNYTFSESYSKVFFTSFFDILKQYLAFNAGIGMGGEGENYGEVNLYYGLLPLLLTTLYFFMGSIPMKKKIKKLAVLVLYLLAFNNNVLNYVMHLFHYPTYYPNRFAIFFTLYSLILAYECFVAIVESEYKEITIKKVVPVCFGWFVLTIAIFAFAHSVGYLFCYYYSMMAFLLYMVLLLVVSKFKKLAPALIGIACVGICFNAVLTGIFRDAQYIWLELSDGRARTEEFLSQQDLEETHGFSRILSAQDVWGGTNTGMLFDIKNPTMFASSLGDTGRMLDSMGIYSTANAIYNYAYTPATLSMLGIHYIYHDGNFDYWAGNDYSFTSSRDLYAGYPIVAEDDVIYLAKRDDTLSIAYRIPEESIETIGKAVDEYDAVLNTTPAKGINTWVSAVSGCGDVMKETKLEPLGIDAQNCYAGYSEGKIYLSVYADDKIKSEIEEKADICNVEMEEYDPYAQSKLQIVFEVPEDGFYYIDNPSSLAPTGYLKKGEQFSYFYVIDARDIEQQSLGTIEVKSFRFDEDEWAKAYDVLSKNQLEVSSYDSTHVTGTIDMDEGGMLFTSIAYDPNWKAYVDGHPVRIHDLWKKAFIGIEVDKGTHEVQFVYKQRGLTLGIVISVLSVLACLLFFLKQDIIMKSE